MTDETKVEVELHDELDNEIVEETLGETNQAIEGNALEVGK